jgi:uncharacterized iron-regulated membrane protein
MKRLRSVVFWLHLPAGVLAGAVILVMSVTGVLLAFESRVVRWIDADAGAGAVRPDHRPQVTPDRATVEVVRFEPYAAQSRGRQLRSWARWVHTGEAAGVLGQSVAAGASAGAVVLVWTGIALSWRRLGAFVGRRRIAVRTGPPGRPCAASLRTSHESGAEP